MNEFLTLFVVFIVVILTVGLLFCFGMIFYQLFSMHKEDVFEMTEGVSGLHHYHISKTNKRTIALCGAPTMPTNCNMDTWGYSGHLGETYCKICERRIWGGD
jgi:hypothetical protein